MASPQPPYAGSSYYHQLPPQPPPPHFAYGSHSSNPYQHQQFQHQPYVPPPPHMAHSPPHMNGMRGGGRGMRGGHSYNHHHNYQTYAPPPPLASPSSPYPRYSSPQYPPSPSYAMQPPYPPAGAWQTQTHQTPPHPPSPMPKQLLMSPKSVYQAMSPHAVSSPTSLAPVPVETQTYVGTIPNPPRTPVQLLNGNLSIAPTPSSPALSSSTHPSSPRPSESSTSSQKASWAIWSRRPRDPAHAPGIIISPLARPPQSIISNAIQLRTPSPSPPPSPQIPVSDEKIALDTESIAATATETTTTTPACSTAPDTPAVPRSPSSTNTSVSLAPASSSSPERAKLDTELDATSVTEEPAEAAPPPASASPAPASVTTKQPPKSWASLLRPSGSSSTAPNGRAPNALPMSSVVGFSIPGADVGSSPADSAVSLPKKSELLALLNGVTESGADAASSAPKIRPRGLINTGNMCFANSVLQILVYCPPFYKLFRELGKHLGGPVVGKGRETPLVDATVEFLKEFDIVEENNSKKGKGKEVDRSGSGGEGDDSGLDSFIPTKIYDAMKEKKRFDNMRGGHQEDAEEFLGFYLDTLEEELLSVVNSLSGNGIVTGKNKEVEEREEEEPPEEDGWMEVGKRNRMVVTRTIKTAESPITRIFGGKFRSTLRAPQQKDSVVIEDWRALQLDIQREQIHTIKDALQLISTPSSVQVTSPTRPGVTLEASQQVLIETVPPILVLHMKRFLYDTQVKGVVKIGKQVGFGSELDVGSEVFGGKKGNIKYKLFGVLYHHGLSASGGHYTLDVLHPNRDLTSDSKPREAWIRIDDEFVSDVRAEDVFGGVDRDDRCAYLLFYRRIGSITGNGRT